MLSSKNIKFSFYASIFIMLYVAFVETDKYETISMVKVKDNDASFELNLLGPLSASKSEIYEVETYLQSNEAKETLIELIKKNIGERSLESNTMDLINNQYFSSKKDYLSSFFDLVIDDSTGILSLKTYGFTNETSFALNNYLIFLAQSYFDRKQMTVNSIKSTNSLCNLSKSFGENVSFSDDQFISSLNAEKESNLTNNPLYTFSEQIRQKCLDDLNNSSNSSNSSQLNFLPSDIKSKQSAIIYEQLISGIIDSEEFKGFLSDKLVMISNPTMPQEPVKKRPILISFIFFISVLLLGFAVNVLLSVFRSVE